MVVLPIVDPNRASPLEDRAVLRHAVRNAREEFRQMKCRVGIMIDPKKEYLPVQIMHATDGAFGPLRR
jgi:hypothetical protein